MNLDDTSWFIKFICVVACWFTSVMCFSFTVSYLLPKVSLYIWNTVLMCYVLYWGPMEIRKRWKNCHNLFDHIINIMLWCWVVYLSVITMVATHNLGVTGELPKYLADVTWPQKDYAPLVYLGAFLCPAIFVYVCMSKAQSRKEEELREKYMAERARLREELWESRRQRFLESGDRSLKHVIR